MPPLRVEEFAYLPGLLKETSRVDLVTPPNSLEGDNPSTALAAAPPPPFLVELLEGLTVPLGVVVLLRGWLADPPPLPVSSAG